MNIIARRMAALKLEPVDVAAACRVAEATARAWQNGTNVPRDQYRAALAAVLKVTLETLAKDFAGAR